MGVIPVPDAPLFTKDGFWVNTWNMITFRMGKSAREINANSDKIADARRRLVAKEEGDEEALTGGKTEHEKQEETVKRHGPRRSCCPSRAAARDSRRRRFAAHVSACRPRIHAHGRRLVASKGNSWSSPILGNGK